MEQTAAPDSLDTRVPGGIPPAPTALLPLPGSREVTRVLPVAAPVIAAGVAAVLAAALTFATGDWGLAVIGGLIVLLGASAFAEAFPVPLEPAGYVSLAAVFVVGAAVTYGWPAAVMVAFLTGAVVDVFGRKPTIRVAYNSANYALSGLAAGVAVQLGMQGGHVAWLIVDVFLGAVGFYVVNVLLTAAVISRWTGEPLVELVSQGLRTTWAPFGIMASVSLMLAVLWAESPFLAVALIGPLVAVALYQRSMHKAMKAMRLALTDAATGLGNKRHFEELLQRYLDRADEEHSPLTLCLIDLDNFKGINDLFGHPVGDRVLSQIATRLRRGGESFRLGGDEFAILLPNRDADEGFAIAQSVARRIAEAKYDHGGAVTASIGVATYPQKDLDRAELVRVADKALYQAKGHGKARVHVYLPDARMTPAAPRPLLVPGRVAGLRHAASAAHAVVARDVYIGNHSHNVGELAARIAHRLGLDHDQVELLRVAGNLHDIGKLLVPEDILHKPGQLTPAERIVVERHSEIGYRMLDALSIDPIALWVLHLHERWAGDGYPNGLAGEDIPIASRILFVADSYDTMTTDRVYRSKVSRAEALDELDRCAGAQFDPAVVAATRAELEHAPLELVLPASA
ncbi:MAG: diguanylate cyclase [Actinobacteria bacterium]|nr:diguanylate cyclase [Actinomycetota bacterium]